MFGAVRRLLSDGDNRILMQGDMLNAYVSIDRQSCEAPDSTVGFVFITLRERRDESGDPRMREPRRKT